MVRNLQATFDLINAEKDFKSTDMDVYRKCGELHKTGDIWYAKCPASYKKYMSLYEPISQAWNAVRFDLVKCEETCQPLREKSWIDKWLGKRGYRHPQAMDGYPDYAQCYIGCYQKAKSELEHAKAEMTKVIETKICSLR